MEIENDMRRKTPTESTMGMENDIQKLFSQILDQYGGNKSAAAEALGVNNVTFWGWVTGKRSLNSVLCGAIDKAGGILLIPGEVSRPASRQAPSSQSGTNEEMRQLNQKIKELEKKVEELRDYKAKWEGHLELVRAQSGLSGNEKKIA